MTLKASLKVCCKLGSPLFGLPRTPSFLGLDASVSSTFRLTGFGSESPPGPAKVLATDPAATQPVEYRSGFACAKASYKPTWQRNVDRNSQSLHTTYKLPVVNPTYL